MTTDSQAILDMVVTDSKLEDATRPVFLTFAGEVEPGEPFAHMVENRRLIDALVARAKAEGIDLRPTAVSSYDSRPEGVTVTLADGNVIEASLLVAADGARSKLRERAGIATHGWDYDQSGIVVTVGHERDHTAAPKSIFSPRVRSRSCRSPASVRRWCGPRNALRRHASPRLAKPNSTMNWRSASACISARSRRSDAARLSARLFVARSFIAERSRWSVMPRT